MEVKAPVEHSVRDQGPYMTIVNVMTKTSVPGDLTA